MTGLEFRPGFPAEIQPADREHEDRPKMADCPTENVAWIDQAGEPVEVGRPTENHGVPKAQHNWNNPAVPPVIVADSIPDSPSHVFDGNRFHRIPQGGC